MIAIRATVTTNVDCPMKIGQKCCCAVFDKHLFHISFNGALLVGAANSSVSENKPETIDSVRKSNKNRPFLRISKNFRKENKETNQTKKTKKTKTKKTGNESTYSNIWPDLFLFLLVLLVAWACNFCTV